LEIARRAPSVHPFPHSYERAPSVHRGLYSYERAPSAPLPHSYDVAILRAAQLSFQREKLAYQAMVLARRDRDSLPRSSSSAEIDRAREMVERSDAKYATVNEEDRIIQQTFKAHAAAHIH
jgi:hypothetical protein